MLALRAVLPRCGGACLSASSSASTSGTAMANAAVAGFSTSSANGMPSEMKRRKAKHVAGMTPQKRAALACAKLFAAGVTKSTAEVQAASEAQRKASHKASVDFLPSIEELENLRPRAPAGTRKGNYIAKHRKVFDAIDQAFVRAQLVTLASEFKNEDGTLNPVPTGRQSKATIIQRIMDRWGWTKPNLDLFAEPRTQGESTTAGRELSLTL